MLYKLRIRVVMQNRYLAIVLGLQLLSSASCSEDAIAAAHSRKCPLCAARVFRRGSEACGVGDCTRLKFSRSVRIQSLKMHPRVQRNTSEKAQR